MLVQIISYKIIQKKDVISNISRIKLKFVFYGKELPLFYATFLSTTKRLCIILLMQENRIYVCMIN